MRNSLLIFAVLCSLGAMHAQQRLSDQFAIQVKGGYVTSQGYNAGFVLERYLGLSPGSVRCDLIYSDSKVGEGIKAESYVGNISYSYSFDRMRWIYINAMCGGVLGAETITINDPLLIIKDKNKSKNRLKYGFSVGIEFEFPLYKRLSFVLSPYYINLINSNMNKNSFSVNGALKLYL
ncbi:MAG: hypothetical protein ACRCZQ_05585 [Bacteroidales bacterium]